MAPTGVLGLVGGNEFRAGNEPHDTILAASAGPGPRLVVPTAAARGRPELAVENARSWFAQFGLALQALPVLRRGDAGSAELAATAAAAGFVYIVGGDPGLLARTLVGTPVGAAIVEAWQAGATLAGSSAGAMVLGDDVLVRERWPGHADRRPIPGLGIAGSIAVLPHFDTFGQTWIPSAQRSVDPAHLLIGIDERTCALWSGDSWRCLGAGTVTLIRDQARTVAPSGAEISDLPPPPAAG